MPGRWRGTWASDGYRPMFRLTDDFEDGTLDTDQWRTFTGAGTSGGESGGLYTLTINASTVSGISLYSFFYDVYGDQFVTELVNAGVQENGFQAYPVNLQVDDNNRLFINVANGFVGSWAVVGGVFTLLNIIPYVPADHRWFRIRENAGTTYWDVSDNGTSWANMAADTNPIPLNAITASFLADTFLPLGTAKSMSIGHVGAL